MWFHCKMFSFFAGRPEPTVTWYNGSEPLQTAGTIAMGRHVYVNKLELPHLSRYAHNTTFRCVASNTKLAAPVEKAIRLDMLRKFLCTFLHLKKKNIIRVTNFFSARRHNNNNKTVAWRKHWVNSSQFNYYFQSPDELHRKFMTFFAHCLATAQPRTHQFLSEFSGRLLISIRFKRWRKTSGNKIVAADTSLHLIYLEAAYKERKPEKKKFTKDCEIIFTSSTS